MKDNIPEFDHVHWQATPEDVRAPGGRRKTNSLFKETIGTAQLKKYPPLYTLNETPQWESYHQIWLPSAKLIYIYSDNEYEAALKLLCSIEHWNMLIENGWFMNGNPRDASWTSLTQWRDEQRDRKMSDIEGQLMKRALEGNVQAIKTLMGMHSEPKRGRPSKHEVEGEKRRQAQKTDDYTEDANRVLHLVKKDS